LQNSPHTHLIDSVADLPRALGIGDARSRTQ
jgi:hypothetical protein